MDQDLKIELVSFVLKRTPVWLFNASINNFSVQKLYARCKQDLMCSYPDLMPYTLDYAIVMAEAFRDYKCDEIKCPDLKHKIDLLKYEIGLARKFGYGEPVEKIKEHNSIVEEYSLLLEPQNRLIKLYKKVRKKMKKSV